MKNSIIKSIFTIDELIQKSKNIIVETITKKYIEIKNNFSPIKKQINKTEESINLKNHKKIKKLLIIILEMSFH